jgi:GNAT superfamily N-acetyltransferase
MKPSARLSRRPSLPVVEEQGQVRPSGDDGHTMPSAVTLLERFVPLDDDTQRGCEAWPTAGVTMTTTMRIARAEPSTHNLEAVLGLIEEARCWLWVKGTDQWERSWPDMAARDARVLRGLEGGKTWIVWDRDIPAATLTVTTRRNAAVWSEPTCNCDLAERAVYVHRLITAREYVGFGLGAELIDWAGLRGQRLYGAKWIRIDVWTSNKRLHGYYQKRGFEPCGWCADPSYPSGALFQKPVSSITKPSMPQFWEEVGVTPTGERESLGMALTRLNS